MQMYRDEIILDAKMLNLRSARLKELTMYANREFSVFAPDFIFTFYGNILEGMGSLV